ncbi:MAG: hypothetical protein ACRCYV_01490, partial [Aeromonas sp.]
LYDWREDLQIEGQFIYSPYQSEHQPDNSRNSLNRNHSDGLSAYLAVNGTLGAGTWQQKMAYQLSDASRQWDGDRFQWPSKAPSVNWCDSSNCAEGGYGALDQTQQDVSYLATFNQALDSGWLAGGELSGGLEMKYTQARKTRPEENNFYTGGKVMAEGVTAQCPAGDPACRPDVALSQVNVYRAYDAQVDLFSQALWGEYARSLGPVDLRAGLRVSHDDFLGNVNAAPRLTANWNFTERSALTVGANRYYAANMVGYAIRSQYPNSYLYKRTVNTSTGEVSEWTLSNENRGTDYAAGDLATPYSDELTAVLTLPAPGQSTLRLKGVLRQNRAGFANSAMSKEDFVPDAGGKPSQTKTYHLTNAGKSDYQALAIEWQGGYTRHQLNANVTWSRTQTSTSSYFDYNDPNEQVYYQGQLIGLDELYALNDRSNFAAPLRAMLGWNARWHARFTTSAQLHYRGGYDFLGDSGESLDGYDVYAQQHQSSFTSVNLNAHYQLPKWQNQQLAFDMRVTNLFNRTAEVSSGTRASYRVGRAVWLGFNYRY